MITIRELHQLPLEGNTKNLGKEKKRQRNNSPKEGFTPASPCIAKSK
jgi:hypothetical protein